MKVALIRPRYSTHLITPPLGIGYIASYLKSKHIACTIIDGLNLNLSNDEIVKLVGDVDVVGISVLSSYFLNVIDLAHRLKKAGKTVIVGGPHATVLPLLTLKKTHADYVVIGEGEETCYKLVTLLAKKTAKKDIKMNGVVSSKVPKITRAPFISYLSQLPMPDWDQIDPNIYQKAPHGGIVQYFPVAPVLTTRGCPYECSFCASPVLWERRLRYRDPKEVVDEIEYLVKEKHVREIHIEDDNFTFNRKHAEEVCKELIRRKLHIAWATPNGIRADRVDKKLLALMKRSGCYSVSFGIESGNQTILANIHKHETLETIEKAVRMAHEIGLITQGFFIFGLPGETKETIRETIDYAKRIPLDKAQFLMLDVIPGSGLWYDLHFEKKVNWNLHSFHEVSWVPPTIDKKILAHAASQAFREFFFRPRTLVTLLKYMKFSQISYYLQRFRDINLFKV